eukprot:COSAG01_NODE_13016_length_1648_cov_20.149128_2_plen_114_part_00
MRGLEGKLEQLRLDVREQGSRCAEMVRSQERRTGSVAEQGQAAVTAARALEARMSRLESEISGRASYEYDVMTTTTTMAMMMMMALFSCLRLGPAHTLPHRRLDSNMHLQRGG